MNYYPFDRMCSLFHVVYLDAYVISEVSRGSGGILDPSKGGWSPFSISTMSSLATLVFLICRDTLLELLSLLLLNYIAGKDLLHRQEWLMVSMSFVYSLLLLPEYLEIQRLLLNSGIVECFIHTHPEEVDKADKKTVFQTNLRLVPSHHGCMPNASCR